LWIVGGKYSIADISCFSWVNWAEWAGIPTKQFPEIEKWLATIQERAAVKSGVDIPEKFTMYVYTCWHLQYLSSVKSELINLLDSVGRRR